MAVIEWGFKGGREHWFLTRRSLAEVRLICFWSSVVVCGISCGFKDD